MDKAYVHVRVPSALYKRFRKLAAANNQSITSQIVELIESWLEQDEARRRQATLLDSIQRSRWTPPPGAPSIVDMVREDRDVDR